MLSIKKTPIFFLLFVIDADAFLFQRNISARDCAFNLERHEIVSRIDKVRRKYVLFYT